MSDLSILIPSDAYGAVWTVAFRFIRLRIEWSMVLHESAAQMLHGINGSVHTNLRSPITANVKLHCVASDIFAMRLPFDDAAKEKLPKNLLLHWFNKKKEIKQNKMSAFIKQSTKLAVKWFDYYIIKNTVK